MKNNISITREQVLYAIEDCITRFEQESGSKPSVMFVSESVYKLLERPHQFMGMGVIWDRRLNGVSVYCNMVELSNS
jgi:hypothetical protein